MGITNSEREECLDIDSAIEMRYYICISTSGLFLVDMRDGQQQLHDISLPIFYVKAIAYYQIDYAFAIKLSKLRFIYV